MTITPDHSNSVVPFLDYIERVHCLWNVLLFESLNSCHFFHTQSTFTSKSQLSSRYDSTARFCLNFHTPTLWVVGDTGLLNFLNFLGFLDYFFCDL